MTITLAPPCQSCPVCGKLLDYHTDANCLEAQGQRVEVARVILRNVLATPYREIATLGQGVMVAVAMSDSQYEALKKFAEGT